MGSANSVPSGNSKTTGVMNKISNNTRHVTLLERDFLSTNKATQFEIAKDPYGLGPLVTNPVRSGTAGKSATCDFMS